MKALIKIIIKQGDIVDERVDAIVNAANSELSGGGGVDGAIHIAAGWDELDEACQKIGRCGVGEAVITGSFKMRNTKCIIHTVGPYCSAHTRWVNEPNDEEKQLLYNCYFNSLKLADRNGCCSIAFPSIASGLFGFPLAYAPDVFIKAVKTYEKENVNIEEVRMVCFDDATYDAFKKGFLDFNEEK